MIARTRIWIAEAMKKLLAEKSIDKIRVTEICRKAEIERPTFYYHFRDKYDLMAWMLMQSAFDTDILDTASTAQAMEKLKKELFIFKKACADNPPTPMWKYMLEYFVDRYTKLAMNILGTDTLDARLRYSIRLFCYGALGMIREWILKDNITPAQTAAAMMYEAMPESMKAVFFGGKKAIDRKQRQKNAS